MTPSISTTHSQNTPNKTTLHLENRPIDGYHRSVDRTLQTLREASMKRKQLVTLRKWLGKSNRKPLIVRGARQVGKSTLVRLFAQDVQRPLVEVNLERFPGLGQIFSQNNPRQILDVLEALPRVASITPDSILFLDEIQAVPEAIAALRYFYEEMPGLALIAAGSLLEFVLEDHRFSMPVGRVEYLHMGPMTFTEFLGALEEEKLLSYITEFELGREIHSIIHDRLVSLLRIYYFVGGMPEAVKTYAESRRLKEVTDIHHSVVETYREDFSKYIGSRSLPRMQSVFNFAARNIGTKVKYSQFSADVKGATIKADIDLLCRARVLTKVTHSHCSGLPLQADIEERIYKLVFLDVGLMNTICGLSWNVISHMDAQSLVNEGAIAEQFVGQHLVEILSATANRELTYWLREGRSSNAEVDYVIAIDGRIVPIEVKAGATGSLKSLHQFVGEKGALQAVRLDTGLPSKENVATSILRKGNLIPVNYELISVPLYLIECLEALFVRGGGSKLSAGSCARHFPLTRIIHEPPALP